MHEVTSFLDATEQVDTRAPEQHLPLVYDELRKPAADSLSRERPSQSLQVTARVHEAYARLMDVNSAWHWGNHGHPVATAAEALRQIPINRARDEASRKRSGEWQRLDLDHVGVADMASCDETLAVSEALLHLERHNKPRADLVKPRFFAGLTMDEEAAALGIAPRTAHCDWGVDWAWFYDPLRPD